MDDFGDVEMSLTFPAPVANASGQEQHTGAQSDFVQLAQEVLPPQMQAMSPSALAEVGKMIAERVGVGWTKAQITAVLAGRALPDQVKVMAGLVKARLRDDISLDEVPKIGKSSLAWSHTLPDGRVVTRRDLDTGTLAIDFHQARIDGLWVGEDRWEFAIAQGVERYLV